MNEIYKYGKRQSELFESDNVNYINCLVIGEGIRKAWKYVYASLICKKLIQPIESLSIEDKKTIWESAKEFANGKLSNNQCIELAKSLYTLEYFLNL